MLETYIHSKKYAACPICKARGINHKFADGELVYRLPEPRNMANGGIVRVCATHGTLFGYHDAFVQGRCNIDFATGERHPNKVQYGFEIECVKRYYPVTVDGIEIASFKEACAYLEYLWGGYACHDGSVDAEIVVPAIRNLNGTRYLWARTAEVVDLTAPECGHHINFSPENDVNAFINRRRAVKVLEWVGEIALENGNTEEVFGRNFTDYARFYQTLDNKQHWDYPYAWVRPNGVVEFRLCKFKSVNQYLRTCWFIDEIGKIILDETDYDAKSVKRKILKRYIKCVAHTTPADKRAKLENGKK